MVKKELAKNVLIRLWQNKKFRKIEKVVSIIIWAGLIYYFSSKSLDFIAPSSYLEVILRQIGHMFEFGLLTFLIFRVLGVTEKKHIYYNTFWAVFFALLYAVLDEYHQLFVPGRVGDYKDVLTDFVGILIVAWLLIITQHDKKFSKRENIT